MHRNCAIKCGRQLMDEKVTPYATGICSGWMQVRGNVRRKNADAGFALSDHCDWEGLITAVKATGAEKVYATHGFQSTFSRYLNEHGIEAGEVKTEYGNEENEVVSGEQRVGNAIVNRKVIFELYRRTKITLNLNSYVNFVEQS